MSGCVVHSYWPQSTHDDSKIATLGKGFRLLMIVLCSSKKCHVLAYENLFSMLVLVGQYV